MRLQWSCGCSCGLAADRSRVRRGVGGYEWGALEGGVSHQGEGGRATDQQNLACRIHHRIAVHGCLAAHASCGVHPLAFQPSQPIHALAWTRVEYCSPKPRLDPLKTTETLTFDCIGHIR